LSVGSTRAAGTSPSANLDLSLEEAPVVRRPGRPKGSVGKKRAENLHSFLSGAQGLSSAAKSSRKKALLPDKKKFKNTGFDIYENSLPMAPVVFDEPAGIDTACDIAVRATKRLLYQCELQNLATFREWASIQDMKVVLDAFKTQKSQLLKRLSGNNTTQIVDSEGDILDFDLVDFEENGADSNREAKSDFSDELADSSFEIEDGEDLLPAHDAFDADEVF
jgi:CO dehydrogenase/acetyl-CoA synthase gamma subunit (corrinoid Fe-S protein)